MFLKLFAKAMEQMAMPHHANQKVLIHHKESGQKELTSGISWEDENVKNLIDFLKAKGISAGKTSVERIGKEIRDTPEEKMAQKTGFLSKLSNLKDRTFGRFFTSKAKNDYVFLDDKQEVESKERPDTPRKK